MKKKIGLLLDSKVDHSWKTATSTHMEIDDNDAEEEEIASNIKDSKDKKNANHTKHLLLLLSAEVPKSEPAIIGSLFSNPFAAITQLPD